MATIPRLQKPAAAPSDCRHLIGSSWIPSVGPSRPICSPYHGETIGTVGLATPAEVDQVVSAAKAAASSWAAKPIRERVQPLFKFRELLLKNLQDLGQMAALESGKTPSEGEAGVLKGIEVLEFAIGLANQNLGNAMQVARDVETFAKREPLGVVCGITPFNFPAMVPLWMYPIAIALGNTFILKPSEQVPFTSQMIGTLLRDAGLPDGVFNLINGDGQAAKHLAAHPDVKALAFVGSTHVAKSLYLEAARHEKRVLALGGAKNHVIVVPDANPSITLSGVLSSFTGCAGQRCMAASVLLLVGDAEAFLAQLQNACKQLVLGQDMGAIINQKALERMHIAINEAIQQGAKLRLDGRTVAPPQGCERGFWLGPTLVDHCQSSQQIVQDEIFGPILAIVRCKTLEEAVAIANRSPYGNATSIFTTSGAAAKYVSDVSEAGMIGVNVGVPVPREPFSFGGTKASKFGAGDITGLSSVEFWTQLKKVTTKWVSAPATDWMS